MLVRMSVLQLHGTETLVSKPTMTTQSLNGGIICWKSSKQQSLAESTVKTKYMVACIAGKFGKMDIRRIYA